MTEPIKIEIELESEDAERLAERLTEALTRLAGETEAVGERAAAAAPSQQRLAQVVNDFSQRAAAAAGQVQALAAQFGQSDVAGAAGLIGRTMQSAAAFGQLGAMLGPQGALVGSIVGAALPALESLIGRHRDAEQAARDHAAEITNLARTMRTELAEQRQAADVAAGVFGSDTSAADLVRLADERRVAAQMARRESEELARRAATERAMQERQGAVHETELQRRAQAAAERVAQLEREEANIQREIERRSQPQESGIVVPGADREALGLDRVEPTRRGTPIGTTQEKDKAARVAAREQDEYNRMLAETAELYARAAEEARAVADAELAIENAAEERWEREQEIIEERKDAEADELDRVRERNEAMKDLYREQIESYQEVTGVVVGGITDTLVAIISGQKSAEDAFRGLLASFLGYISEKAGLKAAEEAAEAIGAYARYDFGSGAQHTAAALAWGGLAIAAGVGAAVAAPPPPPARESPARGAGSRADRGERSGGGEVIINWNSPVVTAQTTAELGRTLQNTIGVAQTRFGR